MKNQTHTLYVGTGRFVIAIDAGTGAEVWRTRLPHVGSSVVTLLLRERQLLVGHAGRVYCLDRFSGEIAWENNLPRTGWYPVLMAMDGAENSSAGGAVAAAIVEQARRNSAHHGSA